MMTDLLVKWAWRGAEDVPIQIRQDGGGGLVGSFSGGKADVESFVWRQGRAEVTLQRDGKDWSVVYTSVGRLLGPRQVIYAQKHRRATHAAWDVMARVIRASRDEEEGLRVARSAAQWMRSANIPDETDD